MSNGDSYNGDPYAYTSGPRDARVILIGEAWGVDEERERKPFVGHSGKELDRILFDAGLSRAQVLTTNLVDARPPSNDFTTFLSPQARGEKGGLFRGVRATPTLIKGHSKLLKLIDTVKPDLVIGAGNWPLWALTAHSNVATVKGYRLPSGIMSHRGSQTYTEEIYGRKYPYLPIIHPAAILRQWGLRQVTVQDLRARAGRFLSKKRSWEAPSYQFDHKPTFKQACEHLRNWLDKLNTNELWICCDVETWRHSYLCVIGLADAEKAICIPFFYFDPMGQMVHVYSLEEEYELHLLVRQLLTHKNIRITNQNYSYDFQFLHRFLHIRTAPSFDTMLGHHLLFPGTPKGLSYLASLYCDHYTYWKDESQDWDARGSHEDMWFYNCKDTRHTYDITFVLQKVIEQSGMAELYESQLQQWELAHAMYLRGVGWDRNRCRSMRLELAAERTRLESYLIRSMPEDIQYAASGKPWYRSNTQQQYIFYQLLGIQPILHKKTKKPTLDKEAFETLKRRAPYIGPIFDYLKLYRSIEVFDNNFLSAKVGWDGRMHPSFNVGGTETFRWSSSSNAFDEAMNFQNIPTDRD
jgi:uracil-DNA glycosylase